MKILKRSFCIVLICAMLFAFAGCDAATSLLGDALNKIAEADNSVTQPALENISNLNPTQNLETNYTAMQLAHGYDALLTDSQRECYDKLKSSVYNVSNTADEGGTYSTESLLMPNEFGTYDMRLSLNAFMEDHPEVFWLDTSFTFSTNNNGVFYTPLSLFNGDELGVMIPVFNNKIDDVFSAMPENLTEYEREVFLHDYILNSVTYDDAAVDSDVNSEYSYNSYGALVNGLAVCEGYSEAFLLLLSLGGIEGCNITGTADGGPHLWTAAKISGNWYYVDTTFDDSSSTGSDFAELNRYKYFNITTEQLAQDHEISPIFNELSKSQVVGSSTESPALFNLFVPQCTAVDMNYYRKELPHITDLSQRNRNELSEELLKAAEDGEDYFAMFADPEYIGVEDAYTLLFDDEKYYFEFVDYVNYTSDEVELLSRATTQKIEAQNVIIASIIYD
ncbi:MAG: hypothetical protein LBM65_07370 [Oscillospiraceae bacterium]|jgi:hypothetical protein|nr:hypothetical protein [Oscillospiraceae bacterium]